MSAPTTGTIKQSSRLPRSISLVTVSANPFHEIRKPSVQRRFLFSIFALNVVNSFLPHLPVQFLHSAMMTAPSRRNRASLASLMIEMSISSVSVRMRPATVSPYTNSKIRLQSSSKLLPLLSADLAVSTLVTS